MSRSAIAERPSFYGGFHTLYEVYATVSCVRYAMCVWLCLQYLYAVSLSTSMMIPCN